MEDFSAALFPVRGRRELLQTLFLDGRSGSARGLGRQVGLGPRAASLVLGPLVGAGLLECEGVGSAHVYRAADGRAARALIRLLRTLEVPPRAREKRAVDVSVVRFGAPLMRTGRGVPAKGVDALERTVATAAKRSRGDATLFRTLPVLLARNATRLDWTALHANALRANSKAEVGLLLDLTGRLAGIPELSKRSGEFLDRRRKRTTFYFPSRNRFDRALARSRTPAEVRKWKFWLNMDLDSLRATLEKHGTTWSSGSTGPTRRHGSRSASGGRRIAGR